MPRAGRVLETVVAILEKALGPLDLSVESPAYVTGRASGTRREIDVAVRGRLGGTELLMIIECRDRIDVEDVRWIEELATKRRDVGADKAIAVSSSGFSSGAVSLAASEGIELRTLKDIDISDSFSWLGLTHLDVTVVRSGSGGIRIQLLNPDQEVMAAFAGRTFESHDDAVFVDKKTGDRISPNEILRREIDAAPSMPTTIPADGSVVTSDLEIRFGGDDIRYQVEGPAGLVDVHGIEFDVHLAAERQHVPLGQLSRYTRDDSVLAENAEFRFTVDGESHVLSLHVLREIETLAASLRRESA